MCVIQATGHADMVRDSLEPVPDLSPSRARRDLALLMPGEIAGVLALVTFGTTKHFRETLYRTFVPRQWQRRQHRATAQVDVESTGISGSAYERAMTPVPWPLVGTGGGGGGERENGAGKALMASEGGGGGGALGHRFGDRGSWTRGVRGLPAPSVPLQDLRSPIFRDSVWRESTLSSIPEYM